MTTNELSDILAMLHPATLPMLKLMFEDARQDAEDDRQPELIARAEVALTALAQLGQR